MFDSADTSPTGRPSGKVSSSLPCWRTSAKSPEREKKKSGGGSITVAANAHGCRQAEPLSLTTSTERDPTIPIDIWTVVHAITMDAVTTDPAGCNASAYKLDHLARKQHWVSDCLTGFVDIEIVADFERTSWGLARLGEWEGGTTSVK
ncbi:hypothetical protein BU17DRAFT_92727 [Hysterangium stoloniferum]|nr:hypothetical protein BU17DRAFT_92727 [Hysterangium stoloniferum]